MKQIDPNAQRLRELLKQKRRILDTMRKHRKSLAKARVEKKRVNEEISKLRKSGYAFSGMSTGAAQARVADEIKAVTPADIYPKDLERRFDKLERTTKVTYKKGKVDVSDIEEASVVPVRRGDEEDEVLATAVGKNDGVIDLGEGEEDPFAVDDLSEEPDAE